jgi:hypothetical protein
LRREDLPSPHYIPVLQVSGSARYMFSDTNLLNGFAYQALSLARPLARLARIIARPPGVRILARNPWVRARFSVLGWNVRFMSILFKYILAKTAKVFTTKQGREVTFCSAYCQQKQGFFDNSDNKIACG